MDAPPTSDVLFRQAYAELRALAAHMLEDERTNHTLQATALVHEAVLRLGSSIPPSAMSRSSLVALAAVVMRRVLVDSARAHRALKRGGGARRIALGEAEREVESNARADDADVLALDAALLRLARVSSRQASVVELRFFGGLNVEQAAEVLGVSARTVESDWRFARAWLRRELAQESEESGRDP
jgi:RNA polymerase sigma factor (TIGR02999 family)